MTEWTPTANNEGLVRVVAVHRANSPHPKGREDRPRIQVPKLKFHDYSHNEYKAIYGQSMLQKNMGYIDSETWRHAHNPAFWGFELHLHLSLIHI